MVHQFGLATYRPGKDDDTLIVEWVNDDPSSLESEIGIGLAKLVNSQPDGFEGEYDVEYWLGGNAVKLFLTIKKNGPIYVMSWSEDGKVTNTGFGFVSDDVLVAGFTR